MKIEVILDTLFEFYSGFYNQSNFYATSTRSLVQTQHLWFINAMKSIKAVLKVAKLFVVVRMFGILKKLQLSTLLIRRFDPKHNNLVTVDRKSSRKASHPHSPSNLVWTFLFIWSWNYCTGLIRERKKFTWLLDFKVKLSFAVPSFSFKR